tara:strand:+ start:760 stop:1473 length:714 start_codon:yes stop_codon:yes gene_type:complete
MKIIHFILYIIKTFLIIFIGLIYLIVATIARFFSKWISKKVFTKYLDLYFKLFNINIQFEYSDNKLKEARNTVFILLNQYSFLDSMVVPMIPTRKTLGIINIEMGLYPVLGWFYLLTNYVIVRQWSNQAKNTLNKTNNFLKSGGNISMSIEGKRSKNGILNEYKKGPVVMAINAQADIVPFIIEGTFELLPYGSLYAKSGDIKVKLLDKISTKECLYKDRNEIIKKLLIVAKKNGLK